MNRCLIAALTLIVAACGSSSSKKSSAPAPTPAPAATTTATGAATAGTPAGSGTPVTPKSDTNGVLTATLDPNATGAQLVKASDSSAVKGASVAFPPGTLAISGDVTLQAGDSLTTAASAADLGIDPASLTSASKTIVVTAPVASSAKPFTINLPVSGASLTAGSTTVVLYRVTKGTDLTKYFTGILSGSAVTISGGIVSVTTTWFGAYEVVTTTADPSTFKEGVATSQPIEAAGALPAAFAGTWKTPCRPCTGGSVCADRETWTFNGSSLQDVTETFADNACATLSETKTAFLTLVQDAAVKETSGLYAINFTFIRKQTKPETAAAAANMNTQKQCGFTDWAVGVSKDTSAAGCNDYTAGQTVYGTVKIDGTTLYSLGQDAANDGTTSAKRVTTFDTTYPYTHQ